MLPAPIPADDSARLADLQAVQLLDTPPEERFDAIVRLAQQLFEVPIAYIALVDSDRQWFKARCGVVEDETSREISFCGHAILQDRLMIVPDARLDTRFHDNPLVIGEPFIRFYAGHPLSGPKGFKIGTLCLADREPRTLTERQQQLMSTLAAMAESQLQLVDLASAQRQLLATQTALLATQARLEGELGEAAAYMRSLLPAPLTTGSVRADWTYESSSQLGGDLFGYDWLDEQHFAMYLLDVCGHGVGASLLASSVHTALRRQSLPQCDFSNPREVLSALDLAFPMDEHHDKFFTIWYGVYDRRSRELRHAAAGHHPAGLHEAGSTDPLAIGQRGLMIGITQQPRAEAEAIVLAPGSRLYLFSDGAFELRRPDGQMLGLEGLNVILRDVRDVPTRRTAEIESRLRAWSQGEPFTDDFSMVELEFV